MSGLRIEAMPTQQPITVAHGIECVLLILEETPDRMPATTLLAPDAADALADLLHRQAVAARTLKRAEGTS